MKTHTFLFNEGRWQAYGFMCNGNKKCTPVVGEAVIVHDNQVWLNKGRMRPVLDDSREYLNVYEIAPFAHGSRGTDFSSHNPALGTIKGRLTVQDDVIVSEFRSEDGKHYGKETLRIVDDSTYENRGELFADETVVSSWEVTLHRVE